MRTNTEYGLEGEFKVDVYNQQGDFVETTDWFHNFITQTGLYYPLTYSFADCFRFLSLGNSSAANSITTTGLASLMGNASVMNSDGVTVGSQKVSHWGKEAYDVAGDSPGACGSQIAPDGPALFRGWNIPSGGLFLRSDLNINEFMVSPSSGNDSSGAAAFSRITKPITIPSGTRSVVSYRLKLKLKNTGAHPFSGGTFTTGNADVSEGSEMVESWSNLSGYFRQVYHGFRLVDTMGRTFIPKYGDGMEPSTKKTNKLFFYTSPLYSQFDVSKSGGVQISEAAAYLADGLLAHSFNHKVNVATEVDAEKFYDLNPTESNDVPDEEDKRFALAKDIRIKTASSYYKAPSLESYNKVSTSFDFSKSVYDFETPIAVATQGKQGYNAAYINQGNVCNFSSEVSNLSFNKAVQTGRKKIFTRKATFPPVNSYDWNTRYGAMVYAYKNGGSFYPIVDTLFYDSSGRSLNQHYRSFSGAHLTERGSGVFDGYLVSTPTTFGKFVARTYQGPVSGGSLVQHNLTGQEYEISTGPVQAGTVEGVTGSDQAGSVFFNGNGWGTVYGVLSPLEVDYGIADHSLTKNTPPNSTGAIYWPRADIASKQEILLETSGLKFYSSGFGIVNDDGGFFDASNQLVAKINFSLSTAALAEAELSDYFAGKKTFDEPEHLSSDGYRGFFLSTLKGQSLNETTIKNAFTGASGSLITGYLVDSSYSGSISGSTWTGAGSIPGGAVSFTVSTTPKTVYVGNGITATGVLLITGAFSNFAQRGSGQTWGASKELSVFFTGISKSSAPLYVVYGDSQSISNDNYDWAVTSDLNTEVVMTKFIPPSGRIIHKEAFRLLPNHGYPQYASDSYPLGYGGSYAGLSSINSLEVYLQTSWSSPCEGVPGCTDDNV